MITGSGAEDFMAGFELPRVTAVRHVRDHVLWLRFANGVEGEADLSDGLHGVMFEPLRDPDFFARVGVDAWTIAWPNGVDWAPEDLYERVAAAIGLEVPTIDDIQREAVAHVRRMPEICRFLGIVIHMLASEHAPPHFHARYGEFVISVRISDGVVTGQFPKRALRLVLEWQEVHQKELAENWDLMRAGQPPRPIPPLE